MPIPPSSPSGLVHCPTEQSLTDLAASFTTSLARGDVCLLFGEMGSGKTCFVRGAYLALGGDARHFASPTFGLVHTYPLPGGFLHHVDLYRLERLAPQDDLGQEEWLHPRDGYTFIEWPERLGSRPSGRAWRIDIAVRPDCRAVRLARIAGHGQETT